jgi:hypothetical protein
MDKKQVWHPHLILDYLVVIVEVCMLVPAVFLSIQDLVLLQGETTVVLLLCFLQDGSTLVVVLLVYFAYFQVSLLFNEKQERSITIGTSIVL